MSRGPTRREVLLGLGAAMCGGLTADRFAGLRRYLDDELGKGVVPGFALAVSKKGQMACQYESGTCCRLGDPAHNVGRQTAHPFYSFSKLVTSTVVGIAVAEGLVDWTTPVRAWIPEFAGGGKDAITVRHLMTHSAGIPNPPGLGSVRTAGEWREGVAAVCKAETEWEPGSRTAYHGLSGQFVVAEAILRRSGERSWAEFCRRRLFGPIGASSLTFAVPDDRVDVSITPRPAVMPGNHFDAFGMAGHPAGGCFGTPADALRVLQVHLNLGRWNGKRVVPEKVMREIHRVQYADEIAAARRDGREPAHEPWGLGPLLRGTGSAAPSLGWFGFMNQSSPGVFGHAGIDTVIGIGDRRSGVALFFATTDSPKPPDATVPLRNSVTDRVFEALASP
ncbi:MAG: beta-lactamase family protein [Chthonomonadales bacterium]|nr:beta-lactamase family protein [Chthonomonadales bacterium]